MRVLKLAALAALMIPTACQADRAVPIPVAKVDAPVSGKSAVAVFAGGCFWGMEAVFEAVKGVKSVTSGYAGGTARTATYDQVTTETTGHAEAIRIAFDPSVVSYATLMRVFFAVAHDPTQLNRQGPDRGPSYRSAIFPGSPAQRAAAQSYIAQLGAARAFPRPIVTRIETGAFYPAEDYHQNFMQKNPRHPYILQWDVPKLAAFRVGFPGLAR